jgi:hypothetical protein
VNTVANLDSGEYEGDHVSGGDVDLSGGPDCADAHAPRVHPDPGGTSALVAAPYGGINYDSSF